MYFPILRGRQEELLALIEAAPVLAALKTVVPVIEPVKDDAKRFARILSGGVISCIVTNPKHGEYKAPGAKLPKGMTDLLDHENAIPTMRVLSATTTSEITKFAAKYDNFAYIVAAPPSQGVMHSIGNAKPDYVIFCDHSQKPTSNMPRTICVSIVDRFNRKGKNDDYTTTAEEITTQHLVNNPRFAHFGDYTIVGDFFPKKGGGLAWTVALHHVYQNGPRRSALYVRHFISDQRGFAGAVPAKTLEALEKLVKFQTTAIALSPDNETPTIAVYRDLKARGHNPGLGPMKRYAIRHHLELVATILQ